MQGTIPEIYATKDVGNFLRVNRDVASVSLKEGQYICSLGRPQRGKVSLAVVASIDEAISLKRFLRKQAGIVESERALTVPEDIAIIQLLPLQANAQLARFCEWAKLDQEEAPPDSDDIIGQEFQDVTVACLIDEGIVTSKANVIVSSIEGEMAIVRFTIGLLEQSCSVPLAALRPQPDVPRDEPPIAIELPASQFWMVGGNKQLFDRIKALPASSTLPADHYCMSEITTVAQPFAPLMQPVTLAWLKEHKSKGTALLALAASRLSTIPSAQIFALPESAKRLWPTDSALSLGSAMFAMWSKRSTPQPSRLNQSNPNPPTPTFTTTSTMVATKRWRFVEPIPQVIERERR